MEPITIVSLLGMLGGAYLQSEAASDAASRQRREALANAQRQDDWSRQAEKKALDRVQEYNTDTRQEEQAGIEQELMQSYLAPVESAQAINAAATTTQGEVSNDYQTARAQSQLNITKNARHLAGLMAKVNSANKLRNNEAIRMTDTGMDIDRMANFANREAFIGEHAVKMAGIPDAGMMAAGSVLQGLGKVGLAGGFDGWLSSGGEASEAATINDWMSKTGAGVGVKGTAPVGMNLGQPIATGGGLGFRAGKAASQFGNLSWDNL